MLRIKIIMLSFEIMPFTDLQVQLIWMHLRQKLHVYMATSMVI